MRDWQSRARDLAAKLAAAGAITDTRWREAFEATPRHLFVPRFWALDEYNSPTRLVDGANTAQREEWMDAAYADQFLATQWAPDGDRRIITSSASLPSLVAAMLRALDVADGHRVLEIGTGTGYNTGLLCHRLGAGNVASVDIDAGLVAEAHSRLETCGYRPLLRAGDGAAGLAEGAPYDRILSTCASPGVPAAWIDQLTPGGRIVAPFTFAGALAVLTKTGPDQVSGRFDPEQAWFMPLRPADRLMPDGHVVDLPEPGPDSDAHLGESDIAWEELADPDFRLWLRLHLPHGHLVDQVNDAFTRTGLVVHTATARATADYPAGPEGPERVRVRQDARRLWDTVETAWHAWERHDRPRRERIGVTATTDCVQYAWLDSPEGGHRWPLPV